MTVLGPAGTQAAISSMRLAAHALGSAAELEANGSSPAVAKRLADASTQFLHAYEECAQQVGDVLALPATPGNGKADLRVAKKKTTSDEDDRKEAKVDRDLVVGRAELAVARYEKASRYA